MSEPWTCSDVGSFAWRTCTQRWPTIVDGLRRDVPAFDAPLQSLRDELVAGTVLPLGDDVGEAPRWSKAHEFAGQPWTAMPWYFAEAFLYARIRALVHHEETRADPFLATKQREERALPPISSSDDVDDALWRSLWGNRADLSLPSAMKHSGSDANDLVADEREAARAMIEGAGNIAILLDNAGVELACDLSLARLLVRRGKRVTLLAKDAPFFVSDATAADVARTRVLLGLQEDADVVDDFFFTGPGFLRSDELPPALRERLAAFDLVIAKGDCNYRRLVRDVPPDDDAFADVVSFPAPVIALRTLKAEVLVGADPTRVARAKARDDDWLVSGRYGLVQVSTVRR
ncbi:MAG: ARMT1-like domain-containing protein [Deltaproteobacteria bacterium]|nr:ARMT1-like domain-containing protein [Deltaproteobacteria bacterium]